MFYFKVLTLLFSTLDNVLFKGTVPADPVRLVGSPSPYEGSRCSHFDNVLFEGIFPADLVRLVGSLSPFEGRVQVFSF